jgi:phosphoribosylglycinamide formyltransferase-1
MRIGVLASGGGTNLQSIIDACRDGRLEGEVGLVISNNSAAGALERARKSDIRTLHMSGKTHPQGSALDRAILEGLTDSGIEYVALAGYMKKLGPKTLDAYRNRVFNIHPALLPRFGGQDMYGMAVHRAVLAAGEMVSGPTVHLVNEEYDEGAILAQEEVPVLEDDDAETLQKRVLEAEHRIYPATLDAVSKGVIAVRGDPPEVIVRPLCITTDFDSAAKVVRSAFSTTAQRFDITRENCPTYPSFVDSGKLIGIIKDGGTLFAAYKASEMIGCVAVEPSRDEKNTWYLEKLAVPPDRRFAGLGTLLVDHALRAISVFGGDKASVGVIEADSGLKNWYRRRGFAETGTRTFPHLPFTVCFMSREVRKDGGAK